MLVHCCGWSWAIVTLGDWKDMKPQPPIYHYLNYIIVFSKYRQRLYIQYKYYMVSLHVFQDPNSMSISWCCRMGKISTIFRTRYDFSEWHMLLWWVLMVYVSMFACDPVPGLRQIISKYKSLRQLVSSEIWYLTIHPRYGKADISKSFSCLKLAGEEQRGESSYHYRTAGCESFQMWPYPKNPFVCPKISGVLRSIPILFGWEIRTRKILFHYRDGSV